MLKWEANVKHVGNIITPTLDDKDDIELNIRDFSVKLINCFETFRD